MKRRHWLQAAGALALAGCGEAPEIAGGFTGTHPERGHRVRDGATPAAPDGPVRRVSVLIAGGGVAGLAAARALRQRGVDDFVLLELEDQAGGNARAGDIGGLAHPLGAHYLPLPGDDAHEVQDLLEELGLRRRVAGRWLYDERHLCHSPQERLFFNGHWQEGLLPLDGVGPGTRAQYARFSQRVEAVRRETRFTLPTHRAGRSPGAQALAAVPFSAWLDAQGLDDAHLRWYLDYACRDDYGAGIRRVSAWAGLHYFASRHGFQWPAGDGESEGVLTWPEGNAWLTQRLAAPLGERLCTGRTVTRIQPARHGVEVDATDAATGGVERWVVRHCIVALPVFVAARVVAPAPAFLSARARAQPYAPWLVANFRLRAPLHDRPGAPPSWDNVVYGARGLGYVDASHQSLDPRPGPKVLTWYLALGDEPGARRALLEQPWPHWRDAALAELSGPHPDLRDRVERVDITRYGHAMAVPVPGPLAGPPPAWERLHFAHADWAGYSVFEEAFTLGHLAGEAVAAQRPRSSA